MLSRRKGLFSIFLFFILTFSVGAFAASDKEFENASECGVENKIVKQFSWEICEQDFAFRVFYKLFPDVMEEYVLPLVNSDYLGRVKDLETSNMEVDRAYQYSLLKVLENTLSLALVFGFYIFIWHAFLALARSTTDGSFLGNEYSWKKTGIKYGFILIGILPLGHGLVVIHIIILALILFGIAFANVFYSMYLNFLDAGSEAVDVSSNTGYFSETDEQRIEEFEKMKNFDHNYFYASELAKNMVKISLCKIRTEQFIFENNVANMSSSNASNYYKCSAESALSSQMLNKNMSGGTGFKSSGAFSSYSSKETNIYNGSSPMNFTSSVKFGKNLQNDNQCQLDGIYDYNCGSLSVNTPSILDSNTTDVMKDVGFFETYSSVSSQIMASGDASSVESAATAGWTGLSAKIIKKIGNEINGEIKLSPNDEVMLKNISYYFHQLLLNDAMIGASVYSKGSNSLTTPSNNNPLKESIVSSFTVAEHIVNNYCIDNPEAIRNSKKLIKYLGSFDRDDLRDVTATCLAITPSQPTKVYGEEYPIASGSRDQANSKMSSNITETQSAMDKMIEKLYNRRVGLERSLFKSLKSVSETSLTAQMRKLGFATAGGMMLKLIKEKDIDSKFMHSFNNSMSFDASSIMNTMVGRENVTFNDKVSSPFDNPNFKPMDEYYGAVVAPFSSQRKDLRFTDISAYTNSVFNDSLTEAGKLENTSDLILETITNPLGSFKTAIGLGGQKDIQKEVIETCLKDLNDCPIPLENPIIHLSNFGHNLIKISTSLIVTSITTSFIKYLATKKISSNLSKNKGGSVSDADSLNNQLTEKLTSGQKATNAIVGFSMKALSSAFNLVDIILSSLMEVFFIMLLVGVFFAYIIPLVPFMMFTFAFLSWITMCLLSLVVAPMWLMFNLRMVEQRNGNSEMFRSGYNIAMQILFRPAIVVFSLVLGWALFIVAFLAVNLTIVPFIYNVLMSDGGTFSVAAMLDGLMLVIIYGLILYLIIRYIFKLMYTMTNQIFEVMNVQAMDDKSNIAEEVMKNSVLSAMLKFQILKSLDSAISQGMKQTTKEMQNKAKYADIDDNIDDELKKRNESAYKDSKPEHKSEKD